MFTVEESALLGRMLRTTAVIVLCALIVLAYLLVRVYAAPDTRPRIVQQPHFTHFVPAHRHRDA